MSRSTSRPVIVISHQTVTAGTLIEFFSLFPGNAAFAGNVLNQASGSAGEVLDQIGDYVRQQPFSAALIALGIGYIIGRLRII